MRDKIYQVSRNHFHVNRWAIDCLKCGKTPDVGLAQGTSGMAWWYRKYVHEQSAEDRRRYEFAEQETRAKKAGLWQEKYPVPLWEFRRTSGQ
jgi:endonuclease YncB( thermonuclease family)